MAVNQRDSLRETRRRGLIYILPYCTGYCDKGLIKGDEGEGPFPTVPGTAI